MTVRAFIFLLTTMKERIVTVKEGVIEKKLRIRFNMAVEIAYEEISGKAFSINDTINSTKDRAALLMAAVVSANPETELTMDWLINCASAKEIAELTSAVYESFSEWCKIPAVVEAEERQESKQEEAEESEKN